MQKQLLLLVLGFTLSSFGQSNYAGVTGTVTDPQHRPVVGAAIQLTAAGTGAMRHVVTAKTIQSASGLAVDQVRVESPVYARFSYNVYGALRMLAAHERRHLWQIERILKALDGAQPRNPS